MIINAPSYFALGRSKMELPASKLNKFTKKFDNNFIYFMLIALITFLYFKSSINNFYYTDDTYWIYIGKKIFTTGILSTDPFYYRIIPGCAFALQYIFFNSHYIFYHITNICLFILNCYMFFLLIRLLFDSKKAAFLSTIIFILNPINFDKINWISMQNYLWLGFFYLFTVYYFLKYIKSHKFRHYFLFSCGYFATLWTNEMGLIIIFILFFIYYGFNFNRDRNISYSRSIVDFLPIFIISTIYLIKIYNYYFIYSFHPFVIKFNYLQFWVKISGFVKFFLYSLNFIALLIPGGDFWLNPYFVKYIIPAFLILFSLLGSFYIRLFLLFIILPILPTYISHFRYFNGESNSVTNWSTATLSSIGFIMIYGFFLAKSEKFSQSLENKRIKFFFKTTVILCFVILCSCLLNNANGTRDIRQNYAKYSYYSDYIKRRFNEIPNDFEVYFLDGSDFTFFSSMRDDWNKINTNNNDFNYLTFLYHLRLTYNVENIYGFAISQKDVLNVLNRPNSIILYINN